MLLFTLCQLVLVATWFARLSLVVHLQFVFAACNNSVHLISRSKFPTFLDLLVLLYRVLFFAAPAWTLVSSARSSSTLRRKLDDGGGLPTYGAYYLRQRCSLARLRSLAVSYVDGCFRSRCMSASYELTGAPKALRFSLETTCSVPAQLPYRSACSDARRVKSLSPWGGVRRRT